MLRLIARACRRAAHRFVLPGAIVSALLLVAAGPAAAAESSRIRVAYQPGATYLPLLVMKHHKLVEKHAQRLGMPPVETTWTVFGSGAAMNDALLSGQVDFAATGTPPAIAFTVEPHNTMVYATFMHERGLIKVRPASWKDMFFPEIHGRDGS